jgi:hypothetical protein
MALNTTQRRSSGERRFWARERYAFHMSRTVLVEIKFNRFIPEKVWREEDYDRAIRGLRLVRELTNSYHCESFNNRKGHFSGWRLNLGDYDIAKDRFGVLGELAEVISEFRLLVYSSDGNELPRIDAFRVREGRVSHRGAVDSTQFKRIPGQARMGRTYVLPAFDSQGVDSDLSSPLAV